MTRRGLTNVEDCETTAGKQTPVSIVNDQDSPSLIMKVGSSKFGLAILHRYFLVTRGMTLGVRVLVQNREGAILLVKHTYVPGWHLPGGGVEHGEDVYTASAREVFEECGIKDFSNLRLLKVVYNPQMSKRDHVALFTANTSEIPSIRNNLEIKTAKFFSLEDLPANFDDMVISMLDELRLSGIKLNISDSNRNYSGAEV